MIDQAYPEADFNLKSSYCFPVGISLPLGHLEIACEVIGPQRMGQRH
jgi:hypothetical protein